MKKKYIFRRAFPYNEYKARNEKAKRLMEKHCIDALLLTQQVNVEYFSGGIHNLWSCMDRPLFMILPRDGEPALVSSVLLKTCTERTTWVEDIRVYPSPRKHAERIHTAGEVVSTLEDLGLSKAVIGIESGYELRINTALRELDAIKGGCPDARFVNSYDVIWGCRKIKSELEIERVQKASEITCKGIQKGFEALEEGMTEFEIAKKMNIAFLEEGADGATFIYTAVMNDPWLGPMIDRHPTNRKLRKGDLICSDCGATYGGYTSDMTRWAFVGKPPEKLRKLYDLALEATVSAEEAMRSGTPTCDLVKAANEPLLKAGHEPYISRIGHSVGMDVHEPPFLGKYNTNPIESGMMFTIEPGVDIGTGHIWIEDLVVVTEKGYRNLTPMPKEELWIVS